MSNEGKLPITPSANNESDLSYLNDRRYGVDKLPIWDRLSYIHRCLQNSIFEAISCLNLGAGDVILDYGCADNPYKKFLPQGVNYVGADIKGNQLADLEISGDGMLPCEAGIFDAVLSTQVLEHVENPGLYLKEAHRVLRSRGALLLSTHGIMVYHEDPVDYWRWTGPGLVKTLENSGFRVETLEGVMGLAPTGLQMFQDAIYPALPRFIRPVWAVIFQSFIALTDRMHSAESRRKNALVFLVIAYKDS